MTPLILGYAVMAASVAYTVWEPGESASDLVASLITGLLWPLWLLTGFLAIFKAAATSAAQKTSIDSLFRSLDRR